MKRAKASSGPSFAGQKNMNASRVLPITTQFGDNVPSPVTRCTSIMADTPYLCISDTSVPPPPPGRSEMASSPAVHRVMAASVRIADRAAEIIRGILRAGDLGIVQKTVPEAPCGQATCGFVGLESRLGSGVLLIPRSHSSRPKL